MNVVESGIEAFKVSTKGHLSVTTRLIEHPATPYQTTVSGGRWDGHVQWCATAVCAAGCHRDMSRGVGITT